MSVNALYFADTVRRGELSLINDLNIPSYALMEKAGTQLWQNITELYPEIKHLTIVCGKGNNAGDGYVLARLAVNAGKTVVIVNTGEPKSGSDAATAKSNLDALSPPHFSYQATLPHQTDLIIDALIGTGFELRADSPFQQLIAAMNNHRAPTLAVDVPSGLNPDTGYPQAVCVKAKHTITFIVYKQGLFTGKARDYCGDIILADLDLRLQFELLYPSDADLATDKVLGLLKQRDETAHKGSNGRAVIIGGNRSYAGAASLATKAASFCGAGLVSCCVHPDSVAIVASNNIESMCHSLLFNSDSNHRINKLLTKANAIVIGPGLDQDEWAQQSLDLVISSIKPEQTLIIDADALNLIAKRENIRFSHNVIITPHPGEAARLLNCSLDEIDKNRFLACKRIQQKYGCTVILKGPGTVIFDGFKHFVCHAGNPGMASGGMGDVLTGVIAALSAQGYPPELAAQIGVCLHSMAADKAANQQGQIGLLASEIMPYIRELININAN
ncbi:NAD(P)H-hydrate dehydratase [Paraferrimonas sp. SM1919]|uniref:NAD(P)H-hydrate dehydratase n=1 Tax=Paraferrimonas sp. SM1919 TaxID=2662263 RepID=UPI0013D7073C|nr:NAD(P)H-hydrate dehydratase [Paraferrimonas sp. SM1919]